jgi:hypothetical protein
VKVHRVDDPTVAIAGVTLSPRDYPGYPVPID